MPIYNNNYVAPVWVNDQPPAIDETEMLAISRTIQASQILKGAGAPTQYTAGTVGQRYADTSTTPYSIYRLVTAAQDANVWKRDDSDGNLALDYNSTSTYSKGNYCIYAGNLYKATTNIQTPEGWTPGHWQQVYLADEVESTANSLAAHVENTSNPHSVTKAQVGLGNVDNTSDADKPVSTLQQAAILNAVGRAPRISSAGEWEVWDVATGAYVSTGYSVIVNPPTVANTAAQMTNHDQVYIYNGSETGYQHGYWYYWNGSAWAPGGAYQVAATDKTLTVADAAADAKATGDAVGELKSALKYNAYDFLSDHKPTNKTSSGITWVVNSDGSVTVNGTATSTSLNDTYSNKAALPNWCIPGKTYHIRYSSDNVDFRMLYTTTPEETSQSLVSTLTDVDVTIPDNAVGLIIRYAVPSNRTVSNETVKAVIMNTSTNEELAELTTELADDSYAISNAINTDTALLSLEWEDGAISSAGKDLDGSTYKNQYIRTGFYPVKLITSINAECLSGFGTNISIWCARYDASKSFIAYSQRNIARGGVASEPWVLEENCKYIRFTARHNPADTTSVSEAAYIKLTVDSNLKTRFDDVEAREDDAINYLSQSLPNPLFANYLSFEKSGLDVSSPPVSLSYTSASIRRSAIVTTDTPYEVTMTNADYVFRLYWFDDDDSLHSTAWARNWEIPSGYTVGLTIKRVDEASFASSEIPQYYLRFYNDTPKAYYQAEIDAVAERIKAANDEPGLCFLLSTDQHTMAVQGTLVKYDTVSDMVVNMKALAKKINFDANISLGDLTDYKVGDAAHFAAYGVLDNTDYPALDALFYKWMDDAMDKLASVHPNFIYLPGNHDDNRYINKDVLHEETSAYDYTPGEMYSYYTQRSQLRKVPNMDNNGLDYYIDFPDFKIRMFCLDANHYYTGDETSPHGYKDCWWYGFQDATVTWMQNQLAAVPGGWSVLVLSHMSPIKEHNADNTAYVNMAAMKAVIQDYIDGGGSYIATLYGHSHVDWSATSPWLEISFDCQKCQNNTPSYTNMPDAVHASRTGGTATEDCWNVVMIQPGSRKIKVIRFGAGDDRTFSY